VKLRIRNAIAVMAISAAASVPLSSQAAGVTDKEIVLGSIQDLSGPVAMLGDHFRNGMQMRFDEANAAGGVHGRRIRLIVEDSGWDTKKGVLAARKLIDQDGVFALINVLGSSIAVATIPLALERNVLSLFPAAPVPIAYEPFSPYKFSLETPYEQQVPIGVRYLAKTAGYRKVGAIYQDDDFGKDVLAGLSSITKELGQQPCEQVSFRRGSTDFSSQVARLKQAGCDLVVIGGSTRETIGIMSEARKLDWKPAFYVTASAYSDQLHKLGGAVVDGLYATISYPHPYEDGATPQLAAWIKAYKSRFNADPSPFSVSGYVKADLFIRAAEKAGTTLTADSLSKALQSLSYSGGDMFGVQAIKFKPNDHLGMRSLRIAQVRNGRWNLITDALN
jgi:branched-chain amino acid transport system substrate-binding protein